MKNIYNLIYSNKKIDKSTNISKKDQINPLENELKRSLNQISGLKLSNKHQYIIEHNGETLYIANSGYVALLEKRIREQLREIRDLQKKISHMTKFEKKITDKMNELIREINQLKQYKDFF